MVAILESVADIERLAVEILADSRNLNSILQLLPLLQSSHSKIVVACVRSLGHIWSELLNRGSFMVQKHLSSTSPENQIALWCKSNFLVCIDSFLALLSASDSRTVQISTLRALMSFVHAESLHMMRIESKYAFDNALFSRIMQCLMSANASGDLLATLNEFYLSPYIDLRLYAYRNVLRACERYPSVEGDDSSGIVLQSIFFLLSNMDIGLVDGESVFVSPLDGVSASAPTASQLQKVFSQCWLAFLKLSLTDSIYKGVLLMLHDKVIPNMTEPRLLHDFLTASYDRGGAASFMALNGLFILITQHNLDYPDFYAKLYQRIDMEVLHMKQRPQFLQLLDIFLKSSHLPSLLVASFIKKLLRVSLYAPPGAILGVLAIMHNFLRRHPAATELLHRELIPALTDTETVDADLAAYLDPFVFEEQDPLKSHASESCLWELVALKEHYLPDVAEYAAKFQTPFHKKQLMQDVKKYIGVGYSSLVTKELGNGRKGKLAYDIPETLVEAKGVVGRFWDIV